VVWEVLHASGDHLTADEVHAAARAQLPELSLPTVYRILVDFIEAHHAREIPIPHGPSRYETICDDDQHGDLVCNTCGRVEKIRDQPLVVSAREATESHPFDQDDLHVVLYGTCKSCHVS
jgi:Fe2+ or Zn2+ uptake regulation protein